MDIIFLKYASSSILRNNVDDTKKAHHKLAFSSMVVNHFENNTIRWKKLATIVSGRKNCCEFLAFYGVIT